MQDDLRINVDEISAAGLGCLVNCVVAIAAADGETSDTEHEAIMRRLSSFVGDAETVTALIDSAFMTVIGKDRASIFEEANNMMNESEREAAFTIACAVAARDGGIGMKEGLAIQALAKALGIGYPSPRYNQLLGRGMQAGR